MSVVKRLVLALALLWALPAQAQQVLCATRPPSDNSNACASTAFVQNATGGSTPATASPNTFLGGPVTGSPAAPTFRLLVPADIPTGIPAANSTYTQGGTGGIAQTLQARGAQQLITPYDFGAVGTDTSADNTPMHNFLAAVASGGAGRLPCGTWQLTTQATASIPNGKHFELDGDGQDCAIIHVVGAINGLVLSYGNQWSSAGISNLTVASDQASGGNHCLAVQGTFANANSATAASTNVINVTARGMDSYSAATQWCGVGLYDSSISNLNVINYTYQSISSRAGTAISVNGTGTGSTYAVQINVVNATINNCNVGVFYGDWVQGLQITNSNITQCNDGVNTVTSASGQLSELSITGSQINASICGVCVNNALIANVQLVNNQLIIPANATGVKLSGTNFTIGHNQFNGASLTGTTGLEILQSYGNGGLVSGNTFAALATGFKADAAAAGQTIMPGNSMVQNTADYSINASASALQINDPQARDYSTLPTCNNAIKFSHFMLGDSTTATFNATVSAGGGSNYLGVNCDGSRYFVD